MSWNPWQRRVNWVVAGLLGALLRPLGCGVLSWSLRLADRLQGSRIPASGDQFPLSDEPGKFRAGIVPALYGHCQHQLGLSCERQPPSIPPSHLTTTLDGICLSQEEAKIASNLQSQSIDLRTPLIPPCWFRWTGPCLLRRTADIANLWLLDAPVQACWGLVGIAPNVALNIILQMLSKLLAPSNTHQPHRHPILANPHARLIDASHHS